MSSSDASPERLALLLRLLDDETPAIRSSIESALSAFQGDVSEVLGGMSVDLSPDDHELLAQLLRPARRERLRREWIVPAGGASAVFDDWEHFEALLRVLSDYLHDGVSLRQPLGDALDLLAEELETIASENGASGVGYALFAGKRLTANLQVEDDPLNFDLARVLSGNPSNALGLGLVFLLLARRLDLDVEGVNLPQSFLCRYHDEGRTVLIEPANGGREVSTEELAHRIRRYPREVRSMVACAASPGELLVRFVEELATAWSLRGEIEDTELMEELLETLVKAPHH